MMRLRHALLLMMALAAAFFAAACKSEQPPQQVVVEYRDRPSAAVEGEIGVPQGIDSFGIVVFAEGTSHMAMTDPEGRFRLSGLLAGTYSIRAMRADLESLSLGTVEVAAADIAKPQPFRKLNRALMDLNRKPAGAAAIAAAFGSLRGSIATPVESDRAGATIEVDGRPYRTVSDDRGLFAFANLEPGAYSFSIKRAGYQPARLTAQVVAGRETVIPLITLAADADAEEPARTIFGQVDILTADGEDFLDFSGVTVQLEGTTYIASPDSAGRFEFRGLPAAAYTVSAAMPGFLLEQKAVLDLQDVPAAEVSLSLVEDTSNLEGSATIVGRVVLGDEPPSAAGVTVALAGTSFSAVTDRAGNFRIDKVDPDVYDLVAAFEGYETAELRDLRVPGQIETDVGDILLEKKVDYPYVVATDPADGTRDVAIDQPTRMQLQFSAEMDVQSVIDALRISPPVGFRVFAGERGMGISGAAFFDVELNAVPGGRDNPSLSYNTEYTVTIEKTATSSKGTSMRDPYRFKFRTGYAIVLDTAPRDRDSDVYISANAPIRVFFNAPIDTESIAVDDIRFDPPLPGSPNLYFRTDPETGWTTMYLAFLANPDTRYRMDIRRGAKTITGDRIRNLPYRINFRTAKLGNDVLTPPGSSPSSDDRRRERSRSSRR